MAAAFIRKSEAKAAEAYEATLEELRADALAHRRWATEEAQAAAAEAERRARDGLQSALASACAERARQEAELQQSLIFQKWFLVQKYGFQLRIPASRICLGGGEFFQKPKN